MKMIAKTMLFVNAVTHILHVRKHASLANNNPMIHVLFSDSSLVFMFVRFTLLPSLHYSTSLTIKATAKQSVSTLNFNRKILKIIAMRLSTLIILTIVLLVTIAVVNGRHRVAGRALRRPVGRRRITPRGRPAACFRRLDVGWYRRGFSPQRRYYYSNSRNQCRTFRYRGKQFK